MKNEDFNHRQWHGPLSDLIQKHLSLREAMGKVSEADEKRTGGGCLQNGTMYIYHNLPIKNASNQEGWRCASGQSWVIPTSYAVCCDGPNTASLPNASLP